MRGEALLFFTQGERFIQPGGFAGVLDGALKCCEITCAQRVELLGVHGVHIALKGGLELGFQLG